ncbi:MAG: FecR domain-containing protein [Acetatifactor sp.]|nr:FecR domain-containing protein [Acetatifactor sp.]
MKNTKNIKIIGGAAAVLAVLVIAIVITLGRNSGSEVYRDISIFELNASATVNRGGTVLDAYEGMRLENGDTIRVADNGYLRLVLDGDKYATLESGTEIRLNATGDNKNSKTEIVLINGAVLNEINNKLNADSSYELSTPTSVMAVRGTVFRVAMTTEGEASHAELIVLDGQVAAAPVLADGTIGDDVLANPGEAVTFDRPDAQSDPICTQTEISYENLPAETLARIRELYVNGRLDDLSITAEELERLYENATGTQSADNNVEEQQPAASEPPETSGTAEASASSVAPENTTTTPWPSSSARPAVPIPSTQTNDTNSAKIDNSVTDYEDKDSTEDDRENDTENNVGDKDHNPSSPTDPGDHCPSPTVYTITFLDANGDLFGTQRVVSGAQAQRPLLSPASSGSNPSPNWCDAQGKVFDFNTAITKNLTLYYR